MKFVLNDKEYLYTTAVKSNIEIKNSFNQLAEKTFGLIFYDWGNNYIPHVILDGERVVSNISVNITDFKWQGQTRHYIQLVVCKP